MLEGYGKLKIQSIQSFLDVYPLRRSWRLFLWVTRSDCLTRFMILVSSRRKALFINSDWRSPRATRLTYEGSMPSCRAIRP